MSNLRSISASLLVLASLAACSPSEPSAGERTIGFNQDEILDLVVEPEAVTKEPDPVAVAPPPADPGPAEEPPTEPEGIEGSDGKRHAGTIEDPVPIDIDFLGQWMFEEKEDPFPDHVLAADGKVVTIIGFMLPDIDFEDIRTFHLVRSLWGCCFGAPPRINEIVRVEIQEDEGVDYTYEAIEVRGVLRVVYETEDGIIEDLYRLEADAIEEIDYADPQAPQGFDPVRDLQGIVPPGR